MPKIKASYYLVTSLGLLLAFVATFYLSFQMIGPFEALARFLEISYSILIGTWWFTFDFIFAVFLFYGIWLITQPEYKDRRGLLWWGVGLNFVMTFSLTWFFFFAQLGPAFVR